ncbi:MAG: Eco57I restriction-modification methylase domain-containing protein [Desulfuromonadaceae bacterium]|nr:Eco57I restriction-modification methylase domain-containing protein [Desulfuromonadaceae bacterium]MDD2855049.1 Eco57I restriction-modification methylase domain-containing protein [Desulfuromonadaceae bacterium]
MTSQAGFTLRGRNPDVLTCIANLSNDEVFTPPEFANSMLDTLAEAWAANNKGANIWADSSVRFLDPFTKSGVFLREITSRLTKGLAAVIPNLDDRVDHILTKQVFGIGITHLTSLLARRSLYCSKHANGEHSIAKSFDSDQGNIWFERMEHTWNETKCVFCGAPRAILDREAGLENYAYAFIHTNDIKARIAELFGGVMQFDVIIGNPPYQMKGGAGGSSDSSIYHLFVEQAKKLEPKYLSMVVPSRWLAGGRGLDEFRKEMLGSGQIRHLIDFPNSGDAFPGVQIKGGVCYFLWEQAHHGCSNVTTIRGDEVIGPTARDLSEFDVFVRDARAVNILHKVITATHIGMDALVSNREPFKLESNFANFHSDKQSGDIALYRIAPGKRRVDWVARTEIVKNTQLIELWKIFVPKAYGAGESVPHQILGKPIIAPPSSVCTGSYLAITADSEIAARSIQSYYVTKFFRFLVSLRKITQDAFSHMYSWVPQQSWDCTWTDEALYKKYDLSQDQIYYIEAVIKPMDLSTEDGDE